MNKENILEMARQAGFELLDTGNGGVIIEDTSLGDALFKFAALILASNGDPSIEKRHGEFPGESDEVFIQFADVLVRVGVPFGHSADDISVELSRGKGWYEPKGR